MKRIFIGLLIVFILSGCSAQSQSEQIIPVPFNSVSLTDGFWKDRMETELNVTIPFSIKQSEPAIERFRRTSDLLAGRSTILPEPHRFISSDLYKVMEGVAYSLMMKPNKDWERFMDETIELICQFVMKYKSAKLL